MNSVIKYTLNGAIALTVALASVPWTLPAFAEGRTSGVSSNTPVTYTTVRDTNHIDIQITEGEFRFWGKLQRTSDQTFVGTDGRVRVMYDRAQGRIVVINAVTGTEFYNYAYRPRPNEYRPPTGEDPSTMCDPRREPC